MLPTLRSKRRRKVVRRVDEIVEREVLGITRSPTIHQARRGEFLRRVRDPHYAHPEGRKPGADRSKRQRPPTARTTTGVSIVGPVEDIHPNAIANRMLRKDRDQRGCSTPSSHSHSSIYEEKPLMTTDLAPARRAPIGS
jgi:hypothetical protein